MQVYSFLAYLVVAADYFIIKDKPSIYDTLQAPGGVSHSLYSYNLPMNTFSILECTFVLICIYINIFNNTFIRAITPIKSFKLQPTHSLLNLYLWFFIIYQYYHLLQLLLCGLEELEKQPLELQRLYVPFLKWQRKQRNNKKNKKVWKKWRNTQWQTITTILHEKQRKQHVVT